MLCRKTKTINLFDKYSITLPGKLKCFSEGFPGKRVLFITDRFESFIVSFEEGMKNMLLNEAKGVASKFFEYSENGKSIKAQRIIPSENENGGYAFFSIEMDDNGRKAELNGQMTAHGSYKWSDNIELTLITILQGVRIKT